MVPGIGELVGLVGDPGPDRDLALGGQGRLVGAQLAQLAELAELAELPIPKALAAALNGTLSTTAATEQAQADLEQIAQSIT